MPLYVSEIDFGDGTGPRQIRGTDTGIIGVSVNGVAQTVTNRETDLDVASNLITEAQWTSLQSILQ